MHIDVPPPLGGQASGQSLPASPGAPMMSPYGSPQVKGVGSSNYVELNDLKAEEAGRGQSRDAENNRDSLPPRPVKSSEDSGWWMFEIIACVVSALALAAILVTIGLMDGQLLKTWPMKITLNSFMSFMSTISKAAMVIPVAEGISQLKWLWFRSAGSLEDIQKFDEASRGSWGSLKLLFHTQRVHLAKLGALVMIAALCMDPFVQQVISYPTKMVTVVSPDGNATIPVAHAYASYAPGAIMALRSPTMDMKAAINSGIYNTNARPQDDFGITPHCATGNCTWPERYRSLAVCSKCANTTSLITVKKDSCINDMCIHALPNGLSFDALLRGQLYMNSTDNVPTVNFNATQPTLASISTMRGLHDLSSQTLLGIVSNECVLYFCVNEYTAEVKNGRFTETIMKSYTTNKDVGMDTNVTITVPLLGNDTETEYVVTAPAYLALQQHFYGFWTGNVTGSTGEERATSDTVRALYDLGEDGSGTGAQKPGGENDTIAAVAASMTRVMRLHLGGDPKQDKDEEQVLGITWSEEAYVSVQWLWMILPVALEVLAFVFLIITIIQCKMSGVAIWKSSTLPLLQGRVKDLQESFERRR